MSDERISKIYSIHIEGAEKALKEISLLTQENIRLKKAQKEYDELLRSGKIIADEHRITMEKNNAQMKLNTQEISKLTKEVLVGKEAHVGLRKELTQQTKALQEMREAGKQGSAEYMEMAKSAGKLRDAVDKANAEIKFFSDDLAMLRGGVATVQLVGHGFQLATATMQLFGSENENLVKGIAKLQQIMAITNSLQQVGNSLRKGGTVFLFAQAMATKAMTAAQWLLNAATNAWPIFLIVSVVSGVIAAVVALVRYWEEMIDLFAGWLGLNKKAEEAEKAAQRQREERIAQREREIAAMKEEIALTDKKIASMRHELRVMKARGDSIENQEKHTRNIMIAEMQNEKAKAEMWIRENQRFIERIKLIGVQNDADKERLEAFEKIKNNFNKINQDLEVFELESIKRRIESGKKVNDEIRKNNQDTRNRKEKAIAEMAALTATSDQEILNAKIALWVVEKNQKLQSGKLTNEEIDLLNKQHQLKVSEAENDFEENKRAAERDRLLETLDGTSAEKLAKLREWHEKEILTEEEHRLLKTEIQAELDAIEAEKQAVRDEYDKEAKALKITSEIDELKKRRDRINADFEAGLISQQAYADIEAAIQEELTQKKNALLRAEANAKLDVANDIISVGMQIAQSDVKYFKFYKTLAKGKVLIDTAKAVMRAYDNAYPLNILYSLLAAATGAFQYNEINKQQPPKFADGGIIGGNPHSLGGTKFVGSDGSVFEAEKGEYLAVVNKHDAQRAAMLDAVNRTHGGGLFARSGNYLADGGIISPRTDFESLKMADIIQETIEGVAAIQVVVAERDITTTQRKVEVLERGGDL